MTRVRHGRRRQLGDVRVPEQVRRVEGQARLPCSRHHLDAEDRVDADLEEVVVDADAAPAQQVRQRSRPGSPPPSYAAGRIRSLGSPSRSSAAGGRRADRSSLPFGESGNALEENIRRRDHRLGHSVLQPAPEVRRRWVGKRTGHE